MNNRGLPMYYKRCFSFLLFAFAVLVFDARTANACSCSGTETVLDAYEGANVIVTAKLVSVDKANEESEKAHSYGGIVSSKLVVTKTYKGALKVGDEMVFAQGGGADCVWTFSEEIVGVEFLFYLGSREKKPKIWIAITCGRSNGVKHATDDLLYLNNIAKVRGKTRISGTIKSFQDDDGLSVGGRKIRIIGVNKSYQVKTDEHGVYEIYDLPAGEYLVEPEIPVGWKLSKYFYGNKKDDSSVKIPVTLEAKKHANLDLWIEIDNAIRGKVYDLSGKPMEDVCINAVNTQSKEDGTDESDCTDKSGNFAITELPRGSYILVINDDGKISSDEPFGTFYYPNVSEREKAAVITIGAGDIIDGLNIRVPDMKEIITVEGVLLYSDGKPVADEIVRFKSEKSKENVESDANAKTDSKGQFSVRILKGLKGDLQGGMYTYIGKFENCPKLESLIKKKGGTNADMETPAIKLNAENDITGVELRFPFPGCKKVKQE